jgi:hypothetical protein
MCRGKCASKVSVAIIGSNGLLSNSTLTVQPYRGERVFMPIADVPDAHGFQPAKMGQPDIRTRFVRALSDCSVKSGAAARNLDSAPKTA